jgi:hypothetical protein
MDAGPRQRPRAPLCAPGPLHPLCLAPRSAPKASNSGTSIRSNTSSRATIEGVKCRRIENVPRQTPSSWRPSPRVEPVIACVHHANLPRAGCSAVAEEPCLSDAQIPKVSSGALLSAAPVDGRRARPSVRNPANASSSQPSLVPQRRRRIDLHRAARGCVTGYG